MSIWSALGSAAIGVGTSLYQNNQNKKAQERANRHNIELAQMNNQFNEQMLQKQMDYNTEMWNKQNEYNTAENQVQRLRQAGLNPAIALGNVSPGTAQSASGVNTPSAQPVQVNPAQYDFSGVSSSIQYALDYALANRKNSADINKLNEETKGLQIENQYKTQEILANLESLRERTKGEKSKRTYQDIINTYAADMQQSQLREINSRYDLNRQNLRNQIKAEMLTDLEIKNYDTKVQAELAEIASNIALNISNKNLTNKQIETEIERKLDLVETKEGKKLDNQSKKDLAPYLLEKARTEATPEGPFGVMRAATTLERRLEERGKQGWELAKDAWRDFKTSMKTWESHSHKGKLRKYHYNK